MNSQIVTIFLIISCLTFLCLFIHQNNKCKELERKKQYADEEIEYLKKEMKELKKTCDEYHSDYDELLKLRELNANREDALRKILDGHKKAFPYLAAIMADYATNDIRILADQLDWGNNQERKKKVIAIRNIRESANERIAEAKVATYQLDYLLSLYPSLEDILDTEEYDELDYSDKGYLQEEGDPIRSYLSREEWLNLPEDEKNQLALDRYIESHTKSKWQIGRDYELYVGYCYEEKGYYVTYFVEKNGLEDLGRDLICQKDGKTLIVQCKYWSKEKEIHEKHIFQLFATTISYCIDNNKDLTEVAPVFITNTKISDEARRVAKQLNVTYAENFLLGTFPRIKCNNGVDENGYRTKIYHLPMDQQYDRVQLIHEDDMKVTTVKEAVKAGYRRAYRWSAMS